MTFETNLSVNCCQILGLRPFPHIISTLEASFAFSCSMIIIRTCVKSKLLMKSSQFLRSIKYFLEIPQLVQLLPKCQMCLFTWWLLSSGDSGTDRRYRQISPMYWAPWILWWWRWMIMIIKRWWSWSLNDDHWHCIHIWCSLSRSFSQRTFVESPEEEKNMFERKYI